MARRRMAACTNLAQNRGPGGRSKNLQTMAATDRGHGRQAAKFVNRHLWVMAAGTGRGSEVKKRGGAASFFIKTQRGPENRDL